MPERLQQLERWLGHACRLSAYEIAPASADASFRRYFRVRPQSGPSLIAMDAPPEREDCGPFVAVAERMRAAGLHVPEIFAQDLQQGFLLLEDLGCVDYLQVLTADSVDSLYSDALDALLRLQLNAPVAGLPPYDRAMLLREMQLFPDWLLDRHLGLVVASDEQDMLAQVFQDLAEKALAQPVVCVHRDYHSRNLMRLETDNPGVIDFQDAVAGPVTYDLVSLLRDCYVRWPPRQVDGWVGAYYRRVDAAGILDGVDENGFREWFDLMGVQRHLKAAGIFARLNHRDGKPGYLDDIPRTLRYIVEVGTRRATIAPLARFIESRVLSAL